MGKVIKYGMKMIDDGRATLVREGSRVYDRLILYNADSVGNLVMDLYKIHKKVEEYAYVVAVNNQCFCIGVSEVSHGVPDATFMNPREVLQRVLLIGGTGFFIVHNHPSGSLKPSMEDTDSTSRIKQAAKVVGVQLIDSIIVTPKSDIISMRSCTKIWEE